VEANTDLIWNPLDSDFIADPYPYYQRLQDEDPVHRTQVGPLLVTRYDDVNEVLRNPRTSVERSGLENVPDYMEPLVKRNQNKPPSILSLDPPDHTRLRKLVQRTFTPRAISRMRDQTTTIVDDLLENIANREEIDLISDYAFVVPFAVIHSMLGLPQADMVRVRTWSQALVQTLEPFMTPEQVEQAIEGANQMDDYLLEALDWKRGEPGDDLLTELISVEEDGDRMNQLELLSMVNLLFVAGHETTVNLIGNGVCALLANSDQLARVQNDPSVDSTLADELLRYDSPVQNSGRRLLEPMKLSGVEVSAGEVVLTALAAANRDTRFWGETANNLNIDRKDASRHTSFGSGVHHCLGAALARMEGEIAITRLVRRFPQLTLAAEPTFNGRIILRGRERIPIIFCQ
tara:strand:+ start:66 stop:1277 length:1212 start_codon:yes stop_codon:yes gene_type:complete